MYYTYMIRCEDNSLYTGMTSDLEKRINEHISKGKNGAKYTKSHNAVKLEIAWKSKEKSLACKLEYQIKTLNKKQKESLIKGEKLSTYLKGKVDCRRYRKV
ncbi:MAG: GIY-YIG nuclease family protein [Clostridia bacterium]|nr:GIY-YIG nuclease family protein [Clostridia bacterium]MCI9274726.1 GIY-YIG nuclease family protein [Clostridia bacterium]